MGTASSYRTRDHKHSPHAIAPRRHMYPRRLPQTTLHYQNSKKEITATHYSPQARAPPTRDSVATTTNDNSIIPRRQTASAPRATTTCPYTHTTMSASATAHRTWRGCVTQTPTATGSNTTPARAPSRPQRPNRATPVRRAPRAPTTRPRTRRRLRWSAPRRAHRRTPPRRSPRLHRAG